jgi:hypothetical protein
VTGSADAARSHREENDFFLGRIAANQLQVARELKGLAMLCRVELAQAGVAERVLRRDPSVCGRANPLGFAKLRGVLALHFVLQARFAALAAVRAIPRNRVRT